MGRKRSLPRFEIATEDAGAEGHDSDEEGLRCTAPSHHSAQGGNITSADLLKQGGGESVVITEAKSKKRITLSLANRHEVVCAVCGQTGHTAGFVGAVYVDCPVKPCYWCKELGHTAACCPYRLDPTLNVSQAHGSKSSNIHTVMQQRESGWHLGHRGRINNIPRRKETYRITSACLKLHRMRITALDFPPGSLNLVCSSDKRGVISVWDFEQVSERTTFEGVHGYQVNSMRFLPGKDGMSLATASCDGLVCVVDIETGMHHSLCNLNPGGWVSGVSNEKNWKMMHSLAVHAAAPHSVLAGDNQGNVHCLDLRSKDEAWVQRVHQHGNKVTSLDCHPHSAHLLLTAGNDKLCKLFDVRMLQEAPASSSNKKVVCEDLVCMEHPRVISAASFSPLTGRSVMTTCGDNRIRVWDRLAYADQAPSRELVHSHDFNRYLSPFRAVWDPKDSTERTIVIGRYISTNQDGLVLHPIDILDAGTGSVINSLVDPNLQLINPVNMPHPLLDVIVTGSSGNLYAWRPEMDEDDAIADAEAAAGPSSAQQEPRGDQPALRGSKFYSVYQVEGNKKKSKGKQKESKG